MLNHLLSSFLQVKGVEHASILNSSGELIAGVGKEGFIPDVHAIIHHISLQLQIAQALDGQDVKEIWYEAEKGQFIEILSFSFWKLKNKFFIFFIFDLVNQFC